MAESHIDLDKSRLPVASHRNQKHFLDSHQPSSGEFLGGRHAETTEELRKAVDNGR
jgi:hypothetical protein